MRLHDIHGTGVVLREGQSLKELFDQRSILYDEYADIIIDEKDQTLEETVTEVYRMLQRNLIYTGITRAKKILVIVGTKQALAYTVKNLTVSSRNTMLKERLQKALPFSEQQAGFHTRKGQVNEEDKQRRRI